VSELSESLRLDSEPSDLQRALGLPAAGQRRRLFAQLAASLWS